MNSLMMSIGRDIHNNVVDDVAGIFGYSYEDACFIAEAVEEAYTKAVNCVDKGKRDDV